MDVLLFQLSCPLFDSFSWQLDISYDKFIRTTNPSHEAIVKEFYSKVMANGDIYRADYEGVYCVNCEEYKVFFCCWDKLPVWHLSALFNFCKNLILLAIKISSVTFVNL